VQIVDYLVASNEEFGHFLSTKEHLHKFSLGVTTIVDMHELSSPKFEEWEQTYENASNIIFF
jgi:hypothetical protein